MKKILDNKVIKIIGKIIYVLLYIIILVTLLVVLTQRFSNNNFTIVGFRIFNVATGSMVPEYNVGDILISKEIDPNELQVGDNIVYQGEKQDFKGKIVTHKIIEKEKKMVNYFLRQRELPTKKQIQKYPKIKYMEK